MKTYTTAAEDSARLITKRYSTSFSLASSLFDGSIKAAIYNIYALVRIADEITDTYRGEDARDLLDALENEVYAAIRREFSTNLVVEAFQNTARTYDIDATLIAPFFASMRMDIAPTIFDEQRFSEYIYGSAEVVGLMCLKVFTGNNVQQFAELKSGAKSLGAAYQKVNFLRDMRADYEELGRFYFPNSSFETFDEATKDRVVKDIKKDFEHADHYIKKLPKNARYAVAVSGKYFESLLAELDQARVEDIKQSRIRIANSQKLLILARGFLASKVGI